MNVYREIAPVLSNHGYSYACTALQGNNNTETNPYLMLREAMPLTTSKMLVSRELYLDFAVLATNRS